MKNIIKENVIKNIILIIILTIIYFYTKNSLPISVQQLDSSSIGNLLVAISIISVIACFGNFEFKYSKIDIKNKGERYFAHTISGLLMLIIGISLIITSVLIKIVTGEVVIIDISLILLYLTCAGYDFSDILEIKYKNS